MGGGPIYKYHGKDNAIHHIAYYPDKLAVANKWGFEFLIDFIYDFDVNVGSLRLLGNELDMSPQGVRTMLRKVGRMENRRHGGNNKIAEENYAKFRKLRIGV